MAQIFEVFMVVLFGLSWPINLRKSFTSRTAKGKSLTFEILIALGYVFGLIGKFVGGNVTYVVWFYVLNLVMVTTDIFLTLRNKKLDKQLDAKA